MNTLPPRQFEQNLIASNAYQSPAMKIDLPARFMLSSRAEHDARLSEISPSSLSLVTPVEPQAGEKVIVYVAELGRFEGNFVERNASSILIGMDLPRGKRDKLAEQLTCVCARGLPDLPENRRVERIVPLMRHTTLRQFNGKETIVKIIDFSLEQRRPGVERQANNRREDSRRIEDRDRRASA